MAATSKRTLSVLCMVAGVAGILAALYLDITGSENSFRGALLILGAALFMLGLYLFPTQKHRSIIYFLFLFPLLFCFAVTVIIPFACGIFYSFTDWNGIKFTQFVGLGNYITMFQQKDYMYSLLVTVVFVVVNMILVNVVGFSLALLCTSKVKLKNFLMMLTM